MPRDLFKNMKVPEGEKTEKKEYTPPEEKLIDSELVSRLIGHYIDERDSRRLTYFYEKNFRTDVDTLESMIREAAGKFNPQYLLDSLTSMLSSESDNTFFYSRTEYLTAVVQALFNLDYGNEFNIDIRRWPDTIHEPRIGSWDIGRYLKGKPDKPVTLNLHGDFDSSGSWAEHCNFTLHGSVLNCGYNAKYCNFTLHDWIRSCGEEASHCDFTLHSYVESGGYNAKHCNFTFHGRVVRFGTEAKHSNFTFYDVVDECGNLAMDSRFDLMPSAHIRNYCASRELDNTLRRLNDKGEVMTFSTWWLNMYHDFKSMFR